MVRIYTRKGDGGSTRLLTGEEVAKDEVRLEALGAIDELVAFLGLARSQTGHEEINARLAAIQSELYLALADIAAAAPGKSSAGEPSAGRLAHDAVDNLERVIDACDCRLPPLRDFVMPGETGGSSALHVARTVCRRAERRVVAAARDFPQLGRTVTYLNRLSDLLFVAARLVDHEAGGADRTFKSAL